MGKLVNKDLYRSVYNNYVRHFSKSDQFSQVGRKSYFSHNYAKKKHVIRINRSNTSTVPMPPNRPTTSLPHTGVGNRIRTAAVARRTPALIMILKDRMSPNYERPDTVPCFLGNILISKCKRGNFHTSYHSKWNNNRKESLHDCKRRPWCVRQLP